MRKSHQNARRGGILLEVLLSIAIFAGAASFVLGAVRTAIDAQMRSLAEQQAVDLAASLMAELENGSLTLSDLREGVPRQLGSNEKYRELVDERIARGLPGWGVDINTQRTEFAGLTLVEVTVFQLLPDMRGAASPDDTNVRYTLRQLMKMRDAEAEAYELDEMLEGLPMEPNGRRHQP